MRAHRMGVSLTAAQAAYPLPATPCHGAGRPLLVAARPLQLWPMLLCKAVLKVMATYRVLHMGLPSQVGWCGNSAG
jgi:hypothetical protein